jgi:asparagine synthase (glutamine-hydrolysing)
MSGIVGIVNLDGAPVDRALLGRMTDFMTFRGPDAQQIWVNGSVGFGHTLLKTTEESEREQQPFALDGRVWIVADARVDAHADLIAKVAARGEYVEHGATDVELLLRAYRTWGEECVEHLLGDFAFAVWDGPRQRLFCARDHLGVKPFFYAHLGGTVIFSNTLDCIRQHPAVSEKLNDLAIADFLLFDLNQDLATTSFVDIQRIPPAHRATWSASGLRMSRYWTLPIDEPIYFKRADDYTDRFKELLDTAVSDRLRINKIAIFMSGGLDSPTLAATACKILRRRSSDCEVRAFTTVVDGLDQNERHYAGLVAERLGIPIHFQDRSARMIDPDWDKTAVHTPEPVSDPTNLAADREEYRSLAAHSRIFFHGEGPDNALMFEWKPYISYLVRKRRFGRLVADIGMHMLRHRRIPLLPTIPRMVKDWTRRDQWRLPFPAWFNPSFESCMGLRQRWEERENRGAPLPSHQVRPFAYRSFHTPLWEALFRGMDAEETAAPVEARHPFVDLRLLRYMLAVPAIPWCRAKYLERRAMRGVLPVSVLRRAKSPLTGDPAWDAVRRQGLRSLDRVGMLAQYVNFDRVPGEAGAHIGLFQVNFRPLALNYWLQDLRRRPLKLKKEERENESISKSAW